MSALVGRDLELEAGDRFLDEVATGMRVLVLEGDPGIGKTTVWAEIARRAAERGFALSLA